MFFVIIAMAMMFAGGVQQVYAKGKAAPVRALEFEIGAGMVSPTNKLDFDKNRVGYNINAELRCNFKTHPFDIGLRVDGGTFHRTLKLNKDLFKFRSLNVMAVFDWNINRKGIFSPYLGIGIGGGLTSNQGMSIKDVANQPFKETVSSAAFCVMPRVGVEIFHRARATLYYKHIKDANSHFGLSVGIVFGGGRK
jgi:opacity protein-like surface antigen